MVNNNDIPAFPTLIHPASPDYPKEGMTLRDYFAGQALIYRLSCQNQKSSYLVAKECYDISDAMLVERSKNGKT